MCAFQFNRQFLWENGVWKTVRAFFGLYTKTGTAFRENLLLQTGFFMCFTFVILFVFEGVSFWKIILLLFACFLLTTIVASTKFVPKLLHVRFLLRCPCPHQLSIYFGDFAYTVKWGIFISSRSVSWFISWRDDSGSVFRTPISQERPTLCILARPKLHQVTRAGQNPFKSFSSDKVQQNFTVAMHFDFHLGLGPNLFR